MAIDTIEQFKSALLFDFDTILDRAMENPKVQAEVIELNQKEQLSEGDDALGQRIRTISAAEENEGNVYSNFTIFKRGAKGLQIDNVDLNDTGAFWKTFKVVKVANGWEVLADFNIHGDDILFNFESKFDFLGLTNENLDFFVFNTLLPQLITEVRKLKKI
jgi:hypothetical protein